VRLRRRAVLAAAMLMDASRADPRYEQIEMLLALLGTFAIGGGKGRSSTSNPFCNRT